MAPSFIARILVIYNNRGMGLVDFDEEFAMNFLQVCETVIEDLQPHAMA